MNALLSIEESEKYGPAVREKLWRLLARQAKSYTLGDSGSLPEEVAEELLKSVLYTLKGYFRDRDETLSALAVQDENQVFDEAVLRLEGLIDATRRLYQTVERNAPRLGHRALEDTLRNIGIGLERYDYRHFAHEVPCEIDYQLCLPVPDAEAGVDWVKEYLRRLGVESAFLSRFDAKECERFLESRFPGYRELLLNLFEQLLPRALGRVMTGEGLDLPHVTPCDLSSLPRDCSRQALHTEAFSLCESMGLPVEFYRYVGDCADALWPRYTVAGKNGMLENIF